MHLPSVRRTARSLTLAAALSTSLLACSSEEELDLDGLAAGACTDARPALSSVDETLRQLADEDVEPKAAAERFQAAQDTVKEAQSGAEPAVAEALKALQTQLGFFRISVDAGSGDGSEPDDVRAALEDVVEVCRPA